MTEQIDSQRLPRHVAVIMDGNGRWAKQRGLQRTEGHVKGVETVRKITEIASQIGIGYLTLYTFSTENWNRPKEEVDALMNLVVVAIERETPDLIKNNVRLDMIGDIERMPEFARERLTRCINDTAHCTGLTLVLALSYSSKWEILEAVKSISARVKAGELDIDDIDDACFSNSLTTRGMPDPDLLIRTGGDLRISNYLLWQIAYSELYFTPKYWPDFDKDDFCEAILEYQRRERRYGKTSEQIKK
ncbi:MAG: isoprenyl transferase [Muribaculaceae bacterium]|nr:isoprenyl transferase [Muribaculaceae bacterium]MDD6020379.1 isoprenyl transferase [bacterium]MDD6026124.1 isoprenyl transferase [bacterium]